MTATNNDRKAKGKRGGLESVGGMPFGVGELKPNHYLEMAKIAWQNRDELGYAWRILKEGVCDGCALGTTGLKDWTIDGAHLCLIRLNLLRLNTMPAFDPGVLRDVDALAGRSSAELRELGRLPYPFLRRRGEPGFRRLSWEEARGLVAERIRRTPPDRQAYYLTSRGTVNETYYVQQKAARFLGTNNIDNASRTCHAPSGVAMKRAIGYGASTCSYKDWIGTDLLVFFGSNTANNQPVTTKYMYEAKKAGTQIALVNPYAEPGMQRYWIPSNADSALFGTKLTDHLFHPHTGGDIAFLNGVLKLLIERGQVDRAFIEAHTEGWEGLILALMEQDWPLLEQASGVPRSEMERFADLVAGARTAVFVWSMGITQHTFGSDAVTAILNLALARGVVGKERCGVMPIRGHSGVQGSAEMGCYPDLLPGGASVGSPEAERIERLWGFEVPDEPGMTVPHMLEAAHRGDLDLFYITGGNFLETMPAPGLVAEALGRVGLRVHQDIVLNTSMLVEGEEVLLLPGATRYETPGGVTETTTERRIIFSPEIAGRRIGEARPEWSILMEIAEAAYPERAHLIHFDDTDAVRREIALTQPAYKGIEHLRQAGDSVQWGGRLLGEGGQFKTPSGRAGFAAVEPPEKRIPAGMFYLSTRRGKQFNSMVVNTRDSLTGADRDHVFIARQDAAELGLQEGDPVLIRSEAGEMRARVRIVPIRPRNLQVHWPEGNMLIPGGVIDPISCVPDYNVFVSLTPLREGGSRE